MGAIFKRGRVWYIDVRANGRRIRKRIGSAKKIAQLALQDAEVKIARNEFGFAQNDIFIDKFFEQFLDYSRANHQPSTYNRYRAVIDHFKLFAKKVDDIGFLSQVTPKTLDLYKVFRKDSWVNPNGKPVESDNDVNGHTRKGARAHTINFEIGALKTMFNLAIKWGYLKENPTTKVKPLKVNDSKPVRFLSDKEVSKFLNACPADLYPIYFTFLNTGMRKAELENLEWDDVDLKRRKIKIRRKEFWQPKTGEREIPISDKLHKLLIKLKVSNDKSIKSNFVFPDSSGTIIRTKLRERLIRIAREADIEGLTKLHTLRHTFASQLVMSGVDLPTVMKLMGHSDIQTTMIYAHLAPDHLADAVNKLSF
ncbi:MAG: tyrosine-type recombinase/integrase [candidate division Zixibacteria bacterium]|nr:tyrosine-type recombinase/integrase [candidate division Zixibacteria bacterium]